MDKVHKLIMRANDSLRDVCSTIVPLEEMLNCASAHVTLIDHYVKIANHKWHISNVSTQRGYGHVFNLLLCGN